MGQFIRVGPFGPIVPRTAERLLQDGYAQTADNVNLLSGEIRPIRNPQLRSSAMANKEAVYRAEQGLVETWRGWTTDVDVVKAPLPEDVEARYVWTGDGPPKWSKLTNFGTVASDLTLGIPAPITAPTATPSGGVGASVTRLYVYTFFSQDGEESPPSPASALTTGKVDDTWAITTIGAVPTNSGTVSGVYGAPDTEFTDTIDTYLRVGDQITLTPTAVVVVVKSITSSKIFKVEGNYSAKTGWARVANWNTTSMKRRLYRSAGTTATYQLVVEDTGGTSYNDTILDADIPGDELISATWSPPPVSLFNVISLPNGVLAGISGNLMCMSEPYQPHAWPEEYQRGMSQEGVGMAAFGTTVVVGTKGVPHIYDGVEPMAVTPQSFDAVWPCLAKRSMISVGDGVSFATTHGLAYIGAAGPKIWTQPYYTREEWDALDPSSMISATAESKVFVRYRTDDMTESRVLLFHPVEPMASLTTLNLDCQELYSDPRNGFMYVVDDEGAKQYDAANGERIPFEWLSKEYELPVPTNFGAARVEFVSEITAADAAAILAAYDAAVAAQPAKIAGGVGALNGRQTGLARNSALNGYTPGLPSTEDADATVTFSLYSKGELVFAKTLYEDTGAFRLPAGFKSDIWSVKLNGEVRVKNVKIAETKTGLKAL